MAQTLPLEATIQRYRSGMVKLARIFSRTRDIVSGCVRLIGHQIAYMWPRPVGVRYTCGVLRGTSGEKKSMTSHLIPSRYVSVCLIVVFSTRAYSHSSHHDL